MKPMTGAADDAGVFLLDTGVPTTSRSRPATRVHGRVLNKATSEPVAGQYVYFTQLGTPLNELGADRLPNPEGSKFWACPRYQQVSEPALVHVSSSDDTAGGIVAVEAAETLLTVPVNPPGSARGRLLKEDGSQAAAGIKLRYGVPISLGDRGCPKTEVRRAGWAA